MFINLWMLGFTCYVVYKFPNSALLTFRNIIIFNQSLYFDFSYSIQVQEHDKHPWTCGFKIYYCPHNSRLNVNREYVMANNAGDFTFSEIQRTNPNTYLPTTRTFYQLQCWGSSHYIINHPLCTVTRPNSLRFLAYIPSEFNVNQFWSSTL